MKRLRVLALTLFLLPAVAPARSRPAIAVDLSAAQRSRESVVATAGALAGGGRQAFRLWLARAESLALRVPFAEAPFNGVQLNAEINGRRLLPYVAFGGDTRYDAVRGKPGMRPPLATIEGRWVIPARWLRHGENALTLWTSGVRPDAALERLGSTPRLRIENLAVGPLDGTALPVYANSIYYDFNVWPQGYPWGEEPDRLNYDLALLGVLNGKGMPCVVPPLGGPESALWPVKRACEANALDWGMGHQEFYTIWEFAGKPGLWAEFHTVDDDEKTQGWFHDQMLYPSVIPKGTDYILYDPARYAAALEAPIRVLAPYTDFYNFKCEQVGPVGQGLGFDGERLKDYGIHRDLWARNYYAANKAAHDLVRTYDPDDGCVQEMAHWGLDLRPILYDTARQRGEPMGNVIDILMMHFAFLAPDDRGPDGLWNGDSSYDKEYPAGGAPPSEILFPEAAITFNRYRLGRTEQDMTRVDPAAHRWASGQPFDFRAGLRGDEMIYNSENGVWNTGYSGPAPYQFLYSFFAYSLLPSAAGEPRQFTLTKRRSPDETQDLYIRTYGEWVEGFGGTKRLRTVDPLYGDLFGWTGQEYCNFGDYISMVGLKEPHHRQPPADAFGLVRRTCYAFVTAGPVVPARLNRGHSPALFVKALQQTFAGRTYLGLYAANFTARPQRLDVTLPVAVPAGADALVYTDRAWDWRASARWLPLPPGDEVRYAVNVPGPGAWLLLLPLSADALAASLALPPAPALLEPAPEADFPDAPPTLHWAASGADVSYRVEVAREALFRPQDRVAVADLRAGAYPVPAALPGSWRYFWRVCAVDARGRRGPWSRPRAFVYRWPDYARAFPPAAAPPVAPAPAAAPRADDPGNLAWLGEIWGTGGDTNAPSRAIDGQEFSFWSAGPDEGRVKRGQPAEWCVIWPQPLILRGVTIRWCEDLLPTAFALQASEDGRNWMTLNAQAEPPGATTEYPLPAPVRARFFRIQVTATRHPAGDVGIREVFLR